MAYVCAIPSLVPRLPSFVRRPREANEAGKPGNEAMPSLHTESTDSVILLCWDYSFNTVVWTFTPHTCGCSIPSIDHFCLRSRSMWSSVCTALVGTCLYAVYRCPHSLSSVGMVFLTTGSTGWSHAWSNCWILSQMSAGNLFFSIAIAVCVCVHVCVCAMRSSEKLQHKLLLHSRNSHTHTHTRTHARTHAHTHARTHARTHAHTHAHTRTHTHTYTHTHAQMHTSLW